MNPVDVTISSFTYFILPNINDDLIYQSTPVKADKVTVELPPRRLTSNGTKLRLPTSSVDKME